MVIEIVGIPFISDSISDGISGYQLFKEIEHAQKSKKIARDLCEFGYEMLDCRKLEVAKETFEKAISFDPTNSEAHLGLFKSAIFEPILTKNPMYYDAEIALKKIEIVLKRNPKDRHAFYFLGEIYRDSDPKKASIYYNKLITLNPKSYLAGLAYNSLAYIAATEKDNDSAFNYMKKAANLCEMNSSVLNNLSYQYSIRGYYDTSIDTLVRLIKHDPYKMIAFWNIINSFRSLGRFEESYVYNKKLIELIEDENSFNYSFSFVSFFFQTDYSGNGVYFNDVSTKKCYSYYSMALTCYLLNKTEEMNMFLEKAQNFDFIDKVPSLKFLYYNIECIQKNNVRVTYKLDNIKGLLEESLKRLDSSYKVSLKANKDAFYYFNHKH